MQNVGHCTTSIIFSKRGQGKETALGYKRSKRYNHMWYIIFDWILVEKNCERYLGDDWRDFNME